MITIRSGKKHQRIKHKKGTLKSFAGPDGAEIGYVYDENNRLTGMAIPDEGTIAFSDFEWNRPKKMTFPGGSAVNYVYDPLMRLKSVASADRGGNTVITRGYAYSPIGNVTEKQTEHSAYTYQYDLMSRLTAPPNCPA